MKSNIVIDSEVATLKPGARIFTGDFVSDQSGHRFEFKEFEFVQYLDKNVHIEGIEANAITPAELFDIRFPKIKVKTDISVGFFPSEKAAAYAFVEMMRGLLTMSEESYQKQFC